ncbi:MAG TPA: ABC transporter permease [Actinomycetota bacterium]|nr:ABC transporter permease [Actinomycetota bacterium]
MSVAQAEARELELEDQSGLWRDAFDRLRRNPGAIAGTVIIAGFAAIALLAPALAPHGPNEQVGGLAAVPPGPSTDFPLGLDQQGRDVLSRIIFGARLSLLVGVVSAGVGLSLGLVLGSLAGYFGRWIDSIIMRVMDLMLAVPQFLLALAIVTALGPGLIQIMFAVGVANVPQFARLLRGGILAQRESDYVLAARSLGAPGRRLLLAHILPNSVAPVIVQGTLAMATAIIDVAGLSFLGLGPADPGLTEWGKMVAENAGRLESAPHLVLFPGFAIVISVLGLNLVGDGLREALDPKLKN